MSYPPIYIINLKRIPERKLQMQRQLDAFNLDYQFVEAIDKYDLRSQEYRAAVARQLNIEEHKIESMYERHEGARCACSLSHIKVFNLIIENNIPLACILEDDARLLPSFAKILIASQEVSWDLLLLSSQASVVGRIMKKCLNFIKGENFNLRIIYSYLSKLMSDFNLNSHTRRLILLKFIKHVLLRAYKDRSFRYKKLIKQVAKFGMSSYFACEIGAIPVYDKSSWHKLISNHYIAKPYMLNRRSGISYRPTSGMAYMLKHLAAIKCKQKISHECLKADIVFSRLYREENLNLNIVFPPCVIAPRGYQKYSTIS